MRSYLAASLLFAISAHAQSSQSTPASNLATQPTGSASVSGSTAPGSAGPSVAQSGNLANVVDYLIPTASVTSLTPEESTKIASDAAAYFTAYTAAHPVTALAAEVLLDGALGTTQPSNEQENSLVALLGGAQTAVVADPSGYISSINALVSPFAFAGAVQSYENGFLDGLRTVVASDLSLSVPPASATSTSTGGASVPTGIVGSAVLAAAGLVGAAML